MADAERLAFEQMLVHNLKAPLTGILASLEMLYDGDLGVLSDVQRSAVGSMQAQGTQLVRLIDELLELGRTESTSFTVQPLPIELGEFVRGVQAEWGSRIHRLTSKIAPDGTDIIADVHVLRRVFDNLLMNARVHAGSNATVQVRAERSGDSVRIEVADDGPGIPSANAARIFEPFFTAGGSGEQRTHGLGLAYCRAALAAMDGTITFVPRERGATFVIELPAAVVLTRQAL